MATHIHVVTDKFHIERSMNIAKNVYAFSPSIQIIEEPYMGGDLSRVES